MNNYTACPNDETLMDFLEHRLAATMREKVEHHMTRCADCREQVAVCAGLLSDGADEDMVTVPAGVTQRAVDAVLAVDRETWPRKLSQNALQWMDRGVEALERLTWKAVPAAVAVRNKTAAFSTGIIHREKRFDDVEMVIEIEKSGADHAMIRVSEKSAQKDMVPVRVALFRQEREIASAVLGDAGVCFEDISLGTYGLVFVRDNKNLGQYDFEITDQP
ncbi:MAG: hypothetical protein HKM93_00775 [Desulfobacteraceae bacterium]|nr:hypothetical protein [Desulfobacteraceae bacterium]